MYNLKETVNKFEARIITEALVASNWSITKAARQLGTIRTTLSMKMSRYGISRPAPLPVSTPELSVIEGHFYP